MFDGFSVMEVMVLRANSGFIVVVHLVVKPLVVKGVTNISDCKRN
jgi:hypothetical protein